MTHRGTVCTVTITFIHTACDNGWIYDQNAINAIIAMYKTAQSVWIQSLCSQHKLVDQKRNAYRRKKIESQQCCAKSRLTSSTPLARNLSSLTLRGQGERHSCCHWRRTSTDVQRRSRRIAALAVPESTHRRRREADSQRASQTVGPRHSTNMAGEGLCLPRSAVCDPSLQHVTVDRFCSQCVQGSLFYATAEEARPRRRIIDQCRICLHSPSCWNVLCATRWSRT